MINSPSIGGGLICALLGSTPVASQEIVSTLPELFDGLKAFYSEVEGYEMPIDGAIGTFVGDQLYYRDSTGSYRVLLDAGRTVRRELEGCEVNLFLDAGQSP